MELRIREVDDCTGVPFGKLRGRDQRHFYRKDAKYAMEEQVAYASGSVSVHFRVLPWQLLFFDLNIR